MKTGFSSPIAIELAAFLAFKRSRGFRYLRAEFMLHSFDRFLSRRRRRCSAIEIGDAILAWLGSRPRRKAISVSMDLAVLREFWRYLRRRDPARFAREPQWPRLPTQTDFVARVLTLDEVRLLLRRIKKLARPRFRHSLYRALFLVLYCTGLRVGEALRLRVRDVDFRRRTLFIDESKGRSRWTPFHPSLEVELRRYLLARAAFVGRVAQPDDFVFVGVNRHELSHSTASDTFCKLFRRAGLKPGCGRIGPRIHDIRHTFAVHRLTRWYRQGADLQACLPWLSASLGHVDLLGTETYLNATPELLGLASDRFRKRYDRRRIQR
jgi:integrase